MVIAMVTRTQYVRGVLGHIGLLFVNFCVLVGLIEAINVYKEPQPLLNTILLAYMVVHTFMLLSFQLGIQVLELIRIRTPSFLVGYYFHFSDEELIPVRILDPTKSKLAVIVLLLVITGGPVLYSIFAVYGFLFIYGDLLIIAFDPNTVLHYFVVFLNWMPPLIGLIVVIAIVSIVIVEFRHV